MTDGELRAYGLSREDRPGFIPAGKSVSDGGDFKTIEQDAATSVWCATSPQLAGMGGVYCQDVDLAEMILPHDSASNVGVRPYAIDQGTAQRLWSLSEHLTGVKFEQYEQSRSLVPVLWTLCGRTHSDPAPSSSYANDSPIDLGCLA